MAKILIVEDNENIRTIVRMALEMGEHKVIEAADGLAGLQTLQTNPDCALIITDLAMPVMDGYEMITRLRAESAFANIPVLVLSAEKDASSALERGAFRIIRKPFSPIELLETVRRVLEA
ncbi:MAG: response regulator [Candidatus Sumerlaeia bacterium]|nr:response regulator [Candidatus Sumerlaeia bacterium]